MIWPFNRDRKRKVAEVVNALEQHKFVGHRNLDFPPTAVTYRGRLRVNVSDTEALTFCGLPDGTVTRIVQTGEMFAIHYDDGRTYITRAT